MKTLLVIDAMAEFGRSRTLIKRWCKAGILTILAQPYKTHPYTIVRDKKYEKLLGLVKKDKIFIKRVKEDMIELDK